MRFKLTFNWEYDSSFSCAARLGVVYNVEHNNMFNDDVMLLWSFMRWGFSLYACACSHLIKNVEEYADFTCSQFQISIAIIREHFHSTMNGKLWSVENSIQVHCSILHCVYVWSLLTEKKSEHSANFSSTSHSQRGESVALRRSGKWRRLSIKEERKVWLTF